MFRSGEEVVIKKQTRAVDKERAHEGQKPGTLPPIDQDLTGEHGAVCADSYFSEEKGEMCIPIQLPNEAMVSVPESRLERVGPRAVTRDGGGQSMQSPLSPETLEFWREFMKKNGKTKKRRKSK